MTVCLHLTERQEGQDGQDGQGAVGLAWIEPMDQEQPRGVLMRNRSLTVLHAAAIVYAAASAAVILFQIALAAGVPWGAYAMGGRFPGKFPIALRLAALAQALLIAGMVIVVLCRAELVLASWLGAARRLIWVIVAVAALGLVLNLITPSAAERAIWAPVAFVLLVSSAVVALKGN